MIYATIDIETTGLNRYKDQITWIGVGLAHQGESNFFREYYLDGSSPKDMKKFKTICNKLREKKAKTVFQNGKFDTLFIEHHLGIKLPISEDVMLIATAYDLAAEHGLKHMAQTYLHVPDWDIKKKDKLSGAADTVVPYLKLDVKYTWELFLYFMDKLTEQQVKIYRKLLKPAYLAYRNIERNGLYLDMKQLKKVKKKYRIAEQDILDKLKAKADINWNSAPQISKTLFQDMGLPVVEKTPKGAPSASAAAMKKLAAQGYEIPSMILEFKDISTRNKMFLNRWEDDVYESCIHPSFGLTNVHTGRTSCSNPNLQQVPRTKDIRGLFHGSPGTVLFEADYSQLELRIAAHYAKDQTMLNIYRHGGDIHTTTAKLFTGGREPTKEERGKAKAVNFGFLYGMMAKKFVDYAFNSYGVKFTQQEATQYREAYFAKYSRLLAWHHEMETLCELQGGVANLFGRFRKLPLIYSSNKWERASAARRAINTPVQGSGSDLLISAVTQVDKELSKYGVKVGATVHDSIIGEIPKDIVDDIVPEIKRIMLHPKVLDDFGVELSVPLDVDVGIGPWGTH